MIDDNHEIILREKILELTHLYSSTHLQKKQFIPGETYIPPTGKVLGPSEIANMVEASLDGWLTSGRFNAAFEERLSKFLGVKHVLTVNSGSSANLVAFSALTSPRLGERAIQEGDEVICVAASFPTTVNPIMQYGAIPVFIDVEIPTYNVDVSELEQAYSERTKAVVLAHTLGNPFNLSEVKRFCDKHNLWLIEDCCDALGSTYEEKMVGSFGDIATLSFYPAHHITMGEGGAVFTNNDTLKMIAESFRDWGRDCYCAPAAENTCGNRYCWKLGDLPYGYDHKYIYSHMGYNLKITDMQAACALAQMQRLDDFIKQRKENFSFLRQSLRELEEFLILPDATECSNPSWFGFPITLTKDAPLGRVELLRYLDQKKIGTRLLFSGNIVKQPYMKNRKFRVASSLKSSDIIMNDTFWIGVFPGLGQVELEYVVNIMHQVLKGDF